MPFPYNVHMSIADNIAKVKQRIAAAAQRAHRDPADITIVAVSKTFSASAIVESIDAGVTDIGENRVQEAKEKYAIIKKPVRWHLVGHLQTNKVKDAVKIFDVIHSLDSLRLAREIQKRVSRPIELAKDIMSFDGIQLAGLMTIGPGWAIENAEASRPCFRMLSRIRNDLAQKLGIELPVLSMGMTSDFEVAIEEGSTMVRIGTAIFGQRPACT
jgi:uncharacterized pyridoxal phosphate-containing UPF0001 family protein